MAMLFMVNRFTVSKDYDIIFKQIMYPKLVCGADFLKKVLPEIRLAKSSIDIIVFYWTFSLADENDPVTRLIKELQDALGRGVKVKILVNNDTIGMWLDKAGFDVRHCYTSKLMHPKAMLIDKKTAVIGSHNYTMSGFTLNMEISVITQFPDVDNDLSTFFKNLWGV